MAHYLELSIVSKELVKGRKVIPFLSVDERKENVRDIFSIPRVSDHNDVLKQIFGVTSEEDYDYYVLDHDLVNKIIEGFTTMDMEWVEKEKHEKIMEAFRKLLTFDLDAGLNNVVVSWGG